MPDDQLQEIGEKIRRIRHDANSPITAALGHTQLLLDDPEAQHPEVQESLKTVERQLQRLMTILAELKDLP